MGIIEIMFKISSVNPQFNQYKSYILLLTNLLNDSVDSQFSHSQFSRNSRFTHIFAVYET